MDKIDLERLKELARAATPGPWELTGLPDIVDILQKDTKRIIGAGYSNENAAFIAAASPDVVLALIADYQDKKDALYGVFLLINKLRDILSLPEDAELHEIINAATERIERLEKEADWLAEYGQGIDMCPFLAFQYGDGKPVPDWCEGSETAEDGFECPKDEPVECWRTAARKAVEEKDDGN